MGIRLGLGGGGLGRLCEEDLCCGKRECGVVTTREKKPVPVRAVWRR